MPQRQVKLMRGMASRQWAAMAMPRCHIGGPKRNFRVRPKNSSELRRSSKWPWHGERSQEGERGEAEGEAKEEVANIPKNEVRGRVLERFLECRCMQCSVSAIGS